MKRILLFIMLIVSVENYSQVYVDYTYKGKNNEVKNEDMEKFKKTTTIFVLPELNKKEDYEKILKEVWTVTPFKVLDLTEFNRLDYTDEKYSIADFTGDVTTTSKGTTYVHTYFEIEVFNKERYDKGFNKLKPGEKKYDEKLKNIVNESFTNIANAPLSVNNEFLSRAMGGGTSEELYTRMYTKDSFTNTSLGMLKNYFQLINKRITEGEHSSSFDSFINPEINNLRDNVLYIPEAYMMEYNPWRVSEKLRDEKDLKNLLEDYKYKFQFIREEDLKRKILNNEEIYYLRYVSMNGNKYIQVVNAKTGNPVYQFYGAGFAYNLKDNDFEKISKAASK